MKKIKVYPKRVLSILLTVLMIVSVVPTALFSSFGAWKQKTFSVKKHTVISAGSNRDKGTYMNLCSDGKTDCTAIGVLQFDISAFPDKVPGASLNMNVYCASTGSGANLLIVPHTAVNHPSSGNSELNLSNDNDNSWASFFFNNNSYISANNTFFGENVLSKFGVTKDDRIGSIAASSCTTSSSGTAFSFDISNLVDEAKAAGRNYLLFALVHEASANNGNTGWTDMNIVTSSVNISYAYKGGTVAKSFFTVISKGNANRGTNERMTICSEGGSAGNTASGLIKFDISSLPKDMDLVKIRFKVARTNDYNSSAVAYVFANVRDRNITGTPLAEGQVDDIYGTSFPTNSQTVTNNALTAFAPEGKDRLSRGNDAVGTISVSNLTTTYSEISFDVTDKYEEAKAEGDTTLQILIIDDKAYNGNSSHK